MKIGLLGIEDPADVRSYSGTPYHLAHFLRRAGHEVRCLGPYPFKHVFLIRLLSRLSKILTGKHLLWQRHPVIARQYPEIINKYAAQNQDLDLLLGTSAFYLAGAAPGIPLAFWGDTTVAGVLGKYPAYLNVSASTIEQAHKVEQEALNAANLAIFSNQWAADVAVDAYSVEAEKVHVITYGANLVSRPSEAEVEASIAARPQGSIDLLLLGTSWYRKGVDLAIEVVTELRRRGHQATLTVAGCESPPGYHPLEYVKVLGMIPKSSPEGLKQLTDLLLQSHVFLLPTRADCAAVVLAEASAYGLPVVTSDVGGNASLVAKGRNGYLLPIEAPIAEWAQAVERIVKDRSSYEAFARNTYRYFVAELSWESSVSKFGALVEETIFSHK